MRRWPRLEKAVCKTSNSTEILILQVPAGLDPPGTLEQQRHQDRGRQETRLPTPEEQAGPEEERRGLHGMRSAECRVQNADLRMKMQNEAARTKWLVSAKIGSWRSGVGFVSDLVIRRSAFSTDPRQSTAGSATVGLRANK